MKKRPARKGKFNINATNGFADDFDWEWLLKAEGMGHHVGQPKLWAPDAQEHHNDGHGHARETEEVVEFRLDTGYEVWSISEIDAIL